MAFDIGIILNICLIIFVIALTVLCVYITWLIAEIVKSVRSANRIMATTERDINSLVQSISANVIATTESAREIVKRLNFLTSFLEVFGAVSTGISVMKGKAKKSNVASRIAVLSALAGLKRLLEVLLGEKKNNI
ncbi:MAG: hypothetical protein KKB81_02040 [Candidatus Margulisbacteria bacterium]|nr:hypothetical protein [Candidatus Margulisiibacteriota bacterium]MBU1022562.1 hypothetical protein [Candidatus Margulisiibacteriota bacterium]MBU1728848.1 hypothetical protein [Candidatus Margulisiibacteriota bacterium]MBU1955479.1 hypothetical protein [Candidatus Margulisiibacteriota bacterium]